jgi:ABC-type cobalamin/Fe3+-siderophores transport system ATPase subunit
MCRKAAREIEEPQTVSTEMKVARHSHDVILSGRSGNLIEELVDIPVNAPVTSDPILRTEHLSRVVKEKILVEDATFEVQTGEVLAIVGPSGSGKSSLLRLLNRLDEPTSGTVYVEAKDYRQIASRELRRKLGLVNQRPYLFPGTVEQNLRFGPEQRGETLSQDAIEQLLTRVGLKGYASRNVANLSGGEAQRVSVARTLANSPLVLLLDEPTSALDETSKREVESAIQRIVREQGLTCILVTHDTAQAARLAGQALVLEAGRVLRHGPISEVLHA